MRNRHLPHAVILFTLFGTASAQEKETYTTNSICLKNRCINPVFPGLEDLHRLSEGVWYCSTLRKTAPSMGFCRGAINYDPAVPAPETPGEQSIATLVKKQDSAASTMFFYHLAGLGLEPWDYQKPGESNNPCVESIWRMACYTYFPRAQGSCEEGAVSEYLRPCQSSCQNYVRSCSVECCDESVQCVFEHTKALTPTTFVTTSGYVPHDGPSTLCTGTARRSASSRLLGAVLLGLHGLRGLCGPQGRHGSGPRATGEAPAAPRLGALRCGLRGVAALVSLLAALALQGWDVDVPQHTVGNWRGETDYLLNFEFVPPGAPADEATLNSCALDYLSQTLQCSGRGVCKKWDEDDAANPSRFCDCDRDWADPECRTRRKSQWVAYLLSLFLGFFGADHFYMGFVYSGSLKLFTLGGFGFWWVIDIIRIGSAPVYTSTFRLATDLPHWVFVLATVSFSLTVGFVLAMVTVMQHSARRRRDGLLLQAEDDMRLRVKQLHQRDVSIGALPASEKIPMRMGQTGPYGPGMVQPFYGSTNG